MFAEHNVLPTAEEKCAVVSEVKFKKLTITERRQIEHHLADGWQRCALSRRFKSVKFEVLDVTILGK